MTYIRINTNTVQAKKFVELIETLSFAEILSKPNSVTKRAMNSAKKEKVTKHKNSKDLISFLNK